MKSVLKVINFKLYNHLLIYFVLQVNGSLLSRMKNRYEYLPLPLPKDFTIDDKDYIDELSPTESISTTAIMNPEVIDQVKIKSTTHYQPYFQTIAMRNFTLLNSEFITASEESNLQKRTITTEAAIYYDQDKWPAIKLFVALTSTRFQQTPSATDPTKHRKRTWPPYFPPKFVSKLQVELDNALLPWKTTGPLPTDILNDVTRNVTKEMGNVVNSETEAYCYMCGLDQPEIPRMPGCYHIFENEDQRTRKLQRHLRVKCIKSNTKRIVKNKHYGPGYIGGCFKRFLDIGIEYNERGCRTKVPTKGKSYASKRLAYLERMLKNTENGCVFSPFASLTPFSRAISLYARYHVCVCNTKYCNGALRFPPSNFYIFFSVLFYLI